MPTIKLTQGYEAIVDDCYLEILSKFKWRIFKTRHYCYGRAWTPMINKKRELLFLHRYIAKIEFGELSKDIVVDHINGNTLDNRIANLRLATKSQNCFNKKKEITSPHLYKGITKTTSGRYRAKIRKIDLGNFLDQESAARAYDRAAKIIAGEFANLNFKE